MDSCGCLLATLVLLAWLLLHALDNNRSISVGNFWSPSYRMPMGKGESECAPPWPIMGRSYCGVNNRVKWFSQRLTECLGSNQRSEPTKRITVCGILVDGVTTRCCPMVAVWPRQSYQQQKLQVRQLSLPGGACSILPNIVTRTGYI